MKILKIFKILIALCIISLITPIASFAANLNDSKNKDMGKLISVEEKEEIQDPQLLLERAKKGISDIQLNKISIKKQKRDSKFLEKFNVDSLVTAQKLKEEKYDKGSTGKGAITLITKIKEKNKNNNEQLTILSSTPPPTEDDDAASGDWDGSYGVYNYTTIYFDYKHWIQDGIAEELIWIDVTQIKSRWDNQDNNYTI